jgi:predicted regulator of Ras-like GTPase activity (Roadblock/LC7/MglB family)
VTAAPSGHRDGLDLRWLLDQLIVRTVGIDMAVLLSADGLLLSRSSGMGLEPAEHLAATAAALTGLARSAGRQFDRGLVHQTAIEMDGGYLLVATAGQGTALALLTDRDPDLGMIVYEMQLLVRRVGDHLGVAPRSRGPSMRSDGRAHV